MFKPSNERAIASVGFPECCTKPRANHRNVLCFRFKISPTDRPRKLRKICMYAVVPKGQTQQMCFLLKRIVTPNICQIVPRPKAKASPKTWQGIPKTPFEALQTGGSASIPFSVTCVREPIPISWGDHQLPFAEMNMLFFPCGGFRRESISLLEIIYIYIHIIFNFPPGGFRRESISLLEMYMCVQFSPR